MDYNVLLKQYPGYAGWGQTEALADYKATGGQGKGGSAQQASAGGGYSMPQAPQVDFSKILEQAQGIYSQSIQPQVQQLQTQPAQTESRYQQLLKDITSQTQKGVTEEMTRRGIPISSGMTQDVVGQRVAAPIAQAGQLREESLSGIDRQIADLRSGAMTGATGLATNLYGTQMSAGESAANRALQMYQQQLQQEQFQKQLDVEAASRAAETDWAQKVYNTITLPESQARVNNTRSSAGNGAATTVNPATEASELGSIFGGGIPGLNPAIGSATGFYTPSNTSNFGNFWRQ